MPNKDVVTQNPSNSAIQFQPKSIPAESPNHNSSKKRKKTDTPDSAKVKNGVDERKSCHQCKRSDRDRVVECKRCNLKRYCVACLTKWYPDVSEEEFVKACPVCCNNCNCKACLRGFSPKDLQGYTCSQPDKIRYSKQILQNVLPLVGRLHENQLMEKLVESKIKGVSTSELQLHDAECDVDDDIFCNNCGLYFFDLYRGCECGYDLCLLCCRELRDGRLKGVTCGWKACVDGSIPCPPKDIGGCGDGILELKRILCVNWIPNLLEKGKGLDKIYTGYNNSRKTMEFNDGCLYSLSAKDIQPQHMQHFQFHWSKGEPIIVNDVLSTSSKGGLSWDPMVLWRAFRDMTDSEVKAINCLNWSEVTVDLNQFLRGYATPQFEKKGMPLILKLEDWQPSCLSKGEWPRHFVEFINCLPFKDYTNPKNGYLNLVVKLPDLSLKPDMGPKMDISYGLEQEAEFGGSVTKLHYDKSDTVNVLTDTKPGVLTLPKLSKTKMARQEHGDQCEADSQRNEGQQYAVDQMVGDALWDIFQRQDVPKLEEYLRIHSAEFRNTDCLSDEVSHPIHEQTFYLNMEHKRKLKDEFGIEPWTFKQKLGDAVFIPAGCPYQVRNLKSNTKVELNFISPESLNECIRLQEELRLLPSDHRAKQQKLNIGKVLIYALDHSVAELSEFINSTEPTTDLQDQFAKVPEILNGDRMNINNHTNGWICESESDDDDSQDTNSVFIALSPLANSNLNVDEHVAMEDDSGTSEEAAAGLWQGNNVGREAKEMLEAIEHHYPDTFKGVHIRSKPYWLSILKELQVFIKGFAETSVEALTGEQVRSLGADLNDYERFGFDLSWARKRLDTVKNVKFGNDALRQELVVLKESLECSYKELVEAKERLETAQLNYDSARDARDKKADEIAQKFGAEFQDMLNGNLGFGMLPGY